MKKVKIALLGLGNVGRGVYIILHQKKKKLWRDQDMKLKFLRY